MSGNSYLRTGIIGTVVTALRCFTPLLVVPFAVLGVSAWLGWIDYLPLPMLGLLLAVTAHALYRWWGRPAGAPGGTAAAGETEPPR